MDHLFSSIVKVQRLVRTRTDGPSAMSWQDVPTLSAVKCRLDMGFLRPGKDVPIAQDAGVVPDRMGVMFCRPIDLRAGDRVVAISGPVVGVFDIKTIPDLPPGYSKASHIEVQIVETVQSLQAPREWPTS